MPWLPRFRQLAYGALPGVALLGLAVSTPGCSIGYLAQQGYFQAELLAGRQPLDVAAKSGTFSEKELAQLALVPQIKAYGKDLGLSSTENYDTINPGWHRTIWNVSACDPVSFTPVVWWFPIVGPVPYLGFFRDQDALARVRLLDDQGYDVYMRTAGAYSTLGWFRDPVLPDMLKYDEQDLADTILHELAHATLWVPGSVQFNESFANFVGEEASMRWLVHQYGEDSEQVRTARDRLEDRTKFTAMLHGVYQDLDALYDRDDLTRDEKLERKHAIFATIPTRTAALGLHRQDAYLRSVRSGKWNNARLVQFRTYNRSRDWFAALLEQEHGDIPAFIAHIDRVTRGADDPYDALAKEVGADPTARR